MPRIALIASPRFFRYWVGYGGILYGILSLALAARAGPGWLALTALLGCLWWWETATGYCRRCTHFNCGPHGILMRRWFARNPSSLPGWRLRLHAAGDLLMFLWPQWWIWHWPWLGAATILWVAVAALAVLPFSDQARGDRSKYGSLPRAHGTR